MSTESKEPNHQTVHWALLAMITFFALMGACTNCIKTWRIDKLQQRIERLEQKK